MATYDFQHIAERESQQRRKALILGVALLGLGLVMAIMMAWLAFA